MENDLLYLKMGMLQTKPLISMLNNKDTQIQIIGDTSVRLNSAGPTTGLIVCKDSTYRANEDEYLPKHTNTSMVLTRASFLYRMQQ
jgi:hypothetical protein